MEVEHRDRRLSLATYLVQGLLHQEQREEAKVAATTHRQFQPEQVEPDRRQFEDLMPKTNRTEWPARGVRDPVAIMAHRVDRRIIAQAVLGENIEGPRRLADNAERRRSIA